VKPSSISRRRWAENDVNSEHDNNNNNETMMMMTMINNLYCCCEEERGGCGCNNNILVCYYYYYYHVLQLTPQCFVERMTGGAAAAFLSRRARTTCRRCDCSQRDTIFARATVRTIVVARRRRVSLPSA